MVDIVTFGENIKHYLQENDINYTFSDAYVLLQKDKKIYVAVLDYCNFPIPWPEPDVENYEELRKKTQSIQIQNKKYINVYVEERAVEYENTTNTVKKLLIWFK